MTEWYRLAGAGGIEPPYGGIKISLIINDFRARLETIAQTRSCDMNSLSAVSK
jgi:hypothetical protein